MSENINPFINYPHKENKTKNIILDALQSIVIAVSLSLFLYLFIINPNEVDGPSMEPTFVTKELLFTSKLHQWFDGTSIGDSIGLDYSRGDVIVFQIPSNPDFIKRIIAVPGDSIAIKDGKYIVNEKVLTEDNFDIKNVKRADGDFLKDSDTAVILKEDEYFVSGDNRDVSHDSRAFGLIKKEWIKGKVVFRFWPLNRFEIIQTGKFIEN